MRTTLSQKISADKEKEMDSIDVHDLPEDQAQLVAAFVEFLRGWQRADQESAAQEQDWSIGSMMSFAKDWDNDKDAIYDNWQDHYH